MVRVAEPFGLTKVSGPEVTKQAVFRARGREDYGTSRARLPHAPKVIRGENSSGQGRRSLLTVRPSRVNAVGPPATLATALPSHGAFCMVALLTRRCRHLDEPFPVFIRRLGCGLLSRQDDVDAC